MDASATQSFTLTVLPVNDAPVFAVGANQQVSEGAGVVEVEGWATEIASGPANESAQALHFEIVGNSNAELFETAVAVSPEGTLTWEARADAWGSATIDVRLVDDGGTANGGVDASAPQSFVITVHPVNRAPSFSTGPDPVVWENEGPVELTNWATDISPGLPEEAGQALHFEIVDVTHPELFAVPVNLGPDGTLTFEANRDAHGSAMIEVRLIDDGGTENGGADTSASQSFTITVQPRNSAPSFVVGADPEVLEDAGFVEIEGWATEIAPGPSDEAGQAVQFEIVSNSRPDLFAAGPDVSPDGTLSWEAHADANGSATIGIRLVDDGGTDDGGVDASVTQTFSLFVTPVNDPPSFELDERHTFAGQQGALEIAGLVRVLRAGPEDESDQVVSFEVENVDRPELFASAPVFDADGTLHVETVPDAAGTTVLTVEARDDGGTEWGGDDRSEPRHLQLVVLPSDGAPLALPLSLTVEEGSTTLIALEGADLDGDELTFTVVSPPSHGTLGALQKTGTSSATVEFTARDDLTGWNDSTTSFEFVVSDGETGSEPATVQVTVRATNAHPVIFLNDQPYGTPGGLAPETTLPFEVSLRRPFPFWLSDDEALDQNHDARAPYYFRLAALAWPEPETDDTDPFKWAHFDINGFAKDAKILKPNFDTGNGGYIQFSSSIGVANEILGGLEFQMNPEGTYLIEFTVIDNGFIGACPEELVRPDPAELDGFDSEDYRKKIGRDGDLMNGDRRRCIRESTTIIHFEKSREYMREAVFTATPPSP